MSQKISIKVEKVSVKKVNTNLFISAFYKNEKVNKSFDDILGDMLRRALKTDSMTHSHSRQ